MRSFVLAMFGAMSLTAVAFADQYWFDFEFNDPNDLPQGEGWLRRYQPQPFGVVQDGILTYDSDDPHSYDFWEYSRPGALDPGPDEIFMCEWRLWTEWVSYYLGDPCISIASDDAWSLGFLFSPNNIYSLSEYVFIPVDPGWRSYRLVSGDMRAYELYIDGLLVRQGNFAHRFLTSLVQWGDGTDGTASTNHWEYFRFGVMPAPYTGDVNCDGTVDFADINPFVQVLADPMGYGDTYPGCPPENADINSDGNVDFGDINPFVELLTS